MPAGAAWRAWAVGQRAVRRTGAPAEKRSVRKDFVGEYTGNRLDQRLANTSGDTSVRLYVEVIGFGDLQSRRKCAENR
jgi:hypothetical protein